jgi:hypothetical protein
MTGRWASLLSVLAVSACTPTNSLSGSLAELFSLDVSRVDVHRNEEAFQVSYYGTRQRGTDLVLRLTVVLEGVVFGPGKTVNLAGEYEPGHQRTALVHLTEGEPLRTLPNVKRGDLALFSGGAADQSTSGSFSLSLDDTTPEAYASGRNVTGTFSAIAADAGFGPEIP